MISITQVVVSTVQDRLGLGRVPAVLLVGGAAAVVSVGLFPTGEGLYILDVADHFINQYGIAMVALVYVVVVAWVLRRLRPLQAHANLTSAVPLGDWWRVMLGIVTPVVLGVMMWDSLRQEFAENYDGYSTGFLVLVGWGVALAVLAFGIVMSMFRWRTADEMATITTPSATE